MTPNIMPLLASALTPLHPGSGRGTGVVDQEVTRDPLGYPYVRGTMIKGALKTQLARKLGCLTRGGRLNCREDVGDCKSCSCQALCCLLGRDTAGDEQSYASILGFMDMYPLALPAPAYVDELPGSGGSVPQIGMVYVTTPVLLSRALTLLDTVVETMQSDDNTTSISNNCRITIKLRGLIEELLEHHHNNGGGTTLVTGKRVVGIGNNSVIRLFVRDVGLEAQVNLRENQGDILNTISLLNMLYKHRNPLQNLLIVDDPMGRMLVEKTLLRQARIRLDRVTKTVEETGLWMEEYLPWGTLLLGGINHTGSMPPECQRVNYYCRALSLMEKCITNAGGRGIGELLSIGGNETTGAGLLRMRPLPVPGGAGDE